MNEHQPASSDLPVSAVKRDLRRTPIHRQLLKLVRDGRIEWCASVGPYGGFAPVGGIRFPPGDGLVALYELRNAELIEVTAETGRVHITAAGLVRLSQWDGWQRAKAS